MKVISTVQQAPGLCHTKTPLSAAAKATGKTAAGALRGKAKQVKKTVVALPPPNPVLLVSSVPPSPHPCGQSWALK